MLFWMMERRHEWNIMLFLSALCQFAFLRSLALGRYFVVSENVMCYTLTFASSFIHSTFFIYINGNEKLVELFKGKFDCIKSWR